MTIYEIAYFLGGIIVGLLGMLVIFIILGISQSKLLEDDTIPSLEKQ